MLARNDKNYIESTVIYQPKIGKTYFIKNKFLSTGEICITLNGDKVDKLISINTANLRYQKQDGEFYYASFYEYFPIPAAALPICDNDFGNLKPPPIFLFKNNNSLFAATQLNIELETDINKSTLSGTGHKLPYQEKYQNTTLQKECQAILCDLNVVVGQLPIVLASNRPKYNFLQKMYNQFLTYNDDSKLTLQYQMSPSRCHIRAHFVNALLNQYGIHSSKVYKFWNANSWRPFNQHPAWGFHCAVMIIASNNKKIIWDPWVGFNKNLLSIPEWVYRNDEPRPVKFMICNKTVLFDIEDGKESDGADMSHLDEENFKIFQSLYASAVPNPPEKPIKLSMQRCTLFSPEKKGKKEQPTNEAQRARRPYAGIPS